jgi:hypothetical protein
MTQRAIIANAFDPIQTVKVITKAINATRRGAGGHPVNLEQPEKEICLLPGKNRSRQVGKEIESTGLKNSIS